MARNKIYAGLRKALDEAERNNRHMMGGIVFFSTDGAEPTSILNPVSVSGSSHDDLLEGFANLVKAYGFIADAVAKELGLTNDELASKASGILMIVDKLEQAMQSKGLMN